VWLRLASAPWWPVRISGAVAGRCMGVAHLALAADRAAHGGHRPDDGALIRHNLHSVVSEKTCAGRIGGRAVQQELNADTWAVGGEVAVWGSVAARRSLTPNALGYIR